MAISKPRCVSQTRDLRPLVADVSRGWSIPANIAEGFRRRGKADKARFLNMAEGPLEECRHYLILVQDLGYGNTAELTVLIEEVGKMLNAYAAAILAPDS